LVGCHPRYYVHFTAATEREREESGDFIFYGYVVGPFSEWGNFRLSEDLPVERDLHVALSRLWGMLSLQILVTCSRFSARR